MMARTDRKSIFDTSYDCFIVKINKGCGMIFGVVRDLGIVLHNLVGSHVIIWSSMNFSIDRNSLSN